MAEDPIDREAATAPDEPAPRKGGRGLSMLAVIFALAALGASGYLVYEHVSAREAPDPTAALEARLREQAEALERRSAATDERVTALATRLEEAIAAERQRREASERALREGLERARQAAPVTGREWKLAEVAYLLRIANHRLLMERDVEGALTLLHAANDTLAALDDFALHGVRVALADEIASLEAVRSLDLTGAFLTLETIKSDLDALPLSLPEYVASRREATRETAADGSMLDELLARLGSFFELRHVGGAGVKPPLTPEQAGYLELNLRLMLERAQLALLRRDALLYQTSLTAAEEWIERYLDLDAPAVRRALGALRDLESVPLDTPLPDISGSLNALREFTGPAS